MGRHANEMAAGPAEDLAAQGYMKINEAVKFSTLSRATLYAMMDRGELPYSKIGGRRLIPIAGLKAAIARGMAGQAALC